MRFGEKLKKNFAKNLQLLRTRNDLTQAKLVDVLNDKYQEFELGLRRTSIVSYEGEAGAMPKIDALYCIADYFGKTIDQIIGPDMDNAGISNSEAVERVGPSKPPEQKSRGMEFTNADQKLLHSNDVNIDRLLNNCVESIANRQFHVVLLTNFLQELEKNEAKEKEKQKISSIFHRTFVNALISKSNYLEQLANDLLDKSEFKVFMAFKERDADMHMVAKGLDMTEQEVFTIFNVAQTKISAFLEGNAKTNLI